MMWVIALGETNQAIGVFVVIDDHHKLEIHYGVARRYWGMGIMTEAAQTALAALWQRAHVSRIWTVCDTQNHGSRRVLEKLGFTCEGRLRNWLALPAFGGAARDCWMYAAVRDVTS
jgi:ribosomal-protein-alanine N-acetyltransferase